MRLVLMFCLSLFSLHASSSDVNSSAIPYGFGFFSMGAQTTSYSENYINSAGEALQSEFITTNPYLLTGSQTRINAQYSFSILAGSTLFSDASKEEYFKDNILLDTHKATYSLTELQVNAQYRFAALQQLTYGLNYTYESFKRYGFSSAELELLDTPLIENRAATLNAVLGYRYSSCDKTGRKRWRYVGSLEGGLAFLVGRSSTLDTFSKTSFDLTQGFSIRSNLYLGYRLIKGLEFAIYFDYLYKLRREDFTSFYEPTTDNTVRVVNSTQINARYGLALTWNYRAFEILDALR